jgi:ADP-heptose:LPS heptosyltransferase
VVLEVPPPLVALLSRLDGLDQVVGRGEPLPSFDLYSPLMSLPHALGTGPDTIPARVPYLSAPPEQAAAWATKLPKGLRVGLAWSGSTKNRGDRNRSIPLAALAPLTALPGIKFISVQKDVREEDRDALQANPRLVSLPLGDDFLDTAAVVANLDIVITVDTAVAHLAGAMGKPLWLLLPFSPDWRWLLDRDDSPWYPTARLFRQDRVGDWDPVIRRVTDALAALAPMRGER